MDVYFSDENFYRLKRQNGLLKSLLYLAENPVPVFYSKVLESGQAFTFPDDLSPE